MTIKVMDDQPLPVKVYINFYARKKTDNLALPETEFRYVIPANDHKERVAFVF